MLSLSEQRWHVSRLQWDRDANERKWRNANYLLGSKWTSRIICTLTTKCWKSHARITLVACFGRMPRFCRFDPELFEKFELKSSLFESSSESISSELPHGDSWSVFCFVWKWNFIFVNNVDDVVRLLLEYWSSGRGGHPIWLNGVEPKICEDNMEGGCSCCCGDKFCGMVTGRTGGITEISLLPLKLSGVLLLFCML